jgi:hypothetical protein
LDETILPACTEGVPAAPGAGAANAVGQLSGFLVIQVSSVPMYKAPRLAIGRGEAEKDSDVPADRCKGKFGVK